MLGCLRSVPDLPDDRSRTPGAEEEELAVEVLVTATHQERHGLDHPAYPTQFAEGLRTKVTRWKIRGSGTPEIAARPARRLADGVLRQGRDGRGPRRPRPDRRRGRAPGHPAPGARRVPGRR